MEYAWSICMLIFEMRYEMDLLTNIRNECIGTEHGFGKPYRLTCRTRKIHDLVSETGCPIRY
jgi:hypothetical protein